MTAMPATAVTADLPEARLPELDEDQLRRRNRLLESRIGIRVPEERRSFLATGLRMRMQEIGCRDPQGYYDLLAHGKGGLAEWSILVDRLTVHETSFFRHEPSFALVGEQLLPAFLESASEGDCFQAWSVGCATGEEPYSLAMLCDAAFARVASPARFAIWATDVSLPALAQARRGRYPLRRLQAIPQGYRHHLRRDAQGFEVRPELRSRVCFTPQNLAEPAACPWQELDLVFCQNVLIYFDRPRRAEILTQLAARLRPGGVLLLGPGDMPLWRHPQMERIRDEGTLAYRRLPTAGDAKGLG